MRKIRIFLTTILFAILALCVAVLSACGATVDAPKGFSLNTDTLVVSWGKVKDASTYTVLVEGNDVNKQKIVRSNSYEELDLLATGTYTIKVKANSSKKELGDSDWSEPFVFEREDESQLRFMLNEDKSGFIVVGVGSAISSENTEVVIPDLYRGKEVVGVKAGAFRGITSMTKLTVGKNVQTIGENAFYGCNNVESVTFAEDSKLDTIEKYAFSACSKIEELVIPDSVTTINESAFAQCKGLLSLTLGNSLETIGMKAFSPCNKLTEIVIPDSVTTIEEYAFSGCSAVTSVTIGSGTTTIGGYAFSGQTKLESLTIGESVELIGEYAFSGCFALTSVVIPDSVTTIDQRAFKDDILLEDIVIGDGVTSIGYNAFHQTKVWFDTQEGQPIYLGKNENGEGNSWLIGYRSLSENSEFEFDETLAVADGTVGLSVQSLYNGPWLTITIPGSVKYVNRYALAYCENLGNLTIGTQSVCELKELSSYSIMYCTALTGFSIGRAAQDVVIGNYVFYGCSNLRTTGIHWDGRSIKSIGYDCFKNTMAYMQVTLSNPVLVAGDWIVGVNLDAAGGLRQYIVPAGVRGICARAFKGTGLTAVYFYDINDSTSESYVRTIGTEAFSGCQNLQAVVMGTRVEEIGAYAFYGCASLRGVSELYEALAAGSYNIPDSVTTIEPYAFSGAGQSARMLITVTLPANLDHVETAVFKNCYYMTGVKFNEGLKYIGVSAFENCFYLGSIKLPDSVEVIYTKAFANCYYDFGEGVDEESRYIGLKTVELGANTRTIASRAFYKCQVLQEIVFPEELQEGVEAFSIGDYAFYRTSALKTLDIPKTLAKVKIGNYAFAYAGLENLTLRDNVASVGNYAFFRNEGLKGVTIDATIEKIGMHAFFGCTNTTIYTGATAPKSDWNRSWNSSNLTVVWGATVGEDDYVVSFVKTENSISNPTTLVKNEDDETYNKVSIIKAPVREGYTFLGWATTEGGEVVYGYDQLLDVPDDTTLYSVWKEAEEESEEQEESEDTQNSTEE